MNPLTKVKLINELNEREADLGIKDSVSWHMQYKDSAWIFIGGFPYELTEGDIICVFSQYGEIANINLVRDKKTGKSKGFCFLCYEDQRSTILAVDNLNGIKIKGRTLRVDHVANYRPPKDSEDIDDITKQLREEGCAPKVSSLSESEDEYLVPVKKPKKDKKEKKKKKDKKEKKKKKAAKEERHGVQTDSSMTAPVKVKKEREDTGYDKYALKRAPESRFEQNRLKQPDKSRDQHENNWRGEREGDGESESEMDKSREGRSKKDLRASEKERGWERERNERERERDRGREGDRDRERERERDKDRQRERDSGRETERKREQERERDREKGRDRERDRDSSRGSTKHGYDREYRRN